MTSTTHTIRRLTRALVLAVALAAFTAPVAVGDSPSDRPQAGAESSAVAAPDWFERAALRASQAQPPDWFERAALRAAQAQQRAALRAAQVVDWFERNDARLERAALRASQAQTPDWLERNDARFERAAARAAITGGDRRSPNTIDAALAAQSGRSSVTQLDLRAPDTRDAALPALSPVIAAVPGNAFDWGDFGFGVAASFGVLLLLLLGAGFLMVRGHRAGRISST